MQRQDSLTEQLADVAQSLEDNHPDSASWVKDPNFEATRMDKNIALDGALALRCYDAHDWLLRHFNPAG